MFIFASVAMHPAKRFFPDRVAEETALFVEQDIDEIKGDWTPDGTFFVNLHKSEVNGRGLQMLCWYDLMAHVAEGGSRCRPQFCCRPSQMPDQAEIKTFQWSPNRRLLAIVSDFNDSRHLYVYDAFSFMKADPNSSSYYRGKLLFRKKVGEGRLREVVTLAWSLDMKYIALLGTMVESGYHSDLSVLHLATGDMVECQIPDRVGSELAWDMTGTLLVALADQSETGFYKFNADSRTLSLCDICFFDREQMKLYPVEGCRSWNDDFLGEAVTVPLTDKMFYLNLNQATFGSENPVALPSYQKSFLIHLNDVHTANERVQAGRTASSEISLLDVGEGDPSHKELKVQVELHPEVFPNLIQQLADFQCGLRNRLDLFRRPSITQNARRRPLPSIESSYSDSKKQKK